MNRRQRLMAAVRGEPVDRVPVSAWGHFFVEETTAHGLADAMVGFQRRHDWDFLKIHARASYHVEGFGFRYEPSRDPAAGHRTLAGPISSPSDWRKLRPLPLTDPALAEQLAAIELIRKAADPDLPLIMTVFSPLDIADKLLDRRPDLLRRHIAEHADDVAAGLAVFAETFVPFLRRLTRSGIDGIYFSTKWINDRKLDAAAYRRLAMPHDLAMLREVAGLGCTLLHVCEDGVDLAAVKDYPVQVVHWDNRAGRNPGLADGRQTVGKTVGGGVASRTLATGTPDEVHASARAAIAETGGRGFVLGPGCSVLIARTPAENLHALRRAAAD